MPQRAESANFVNVLLNTPMATVVYIHICICMYVHTSKYPSGVIWWREIKSQWKKAPKWKWSKAPKFRCRQTQQKLSLPSNLVGNPAQNVVTTYLQISLWITFTRACPKRKVLTYKHTNRLQGSTYLQTYHKSTDMHIGNYWGSHYLQTYPNAENNQEILPITSYRCTY